jgi:aminoglycoside phosphotransferase (APT) family kinase protein
MNAAARLTVPMQNLLAGFPGWPGVHQARLQSMGAGLNNRVVRVGFADEDLVVRQSLPAAGAVKLSPARELGALAAAAAAGVAPPLRAVDPDSGISVSEYLPAVRAWTHSDLRQADNLQRLVRHLKVLHGLDYSLPLFDPESAARAYVGRAPGLAIGQRDELLSLTSNFQAQFTAQVFCHNDLMAENILDNGHVWLIDFEYAVMSDPIIDLAGVAALNGIGEDMRAQLLHAYYGAQAPDLEQFDRVCRMVLLLALAWALALGGATPAAGWLDLQHRLRARLSLFGH